MSIKVLIADDHTLVREGIKALLKEKREIEVIDSASTGSEIISKTKELNPDVILLDISMPEVENLSFCKKIKEISPNTKIIILTMHFSEEYVKEAFKNGAEGYILKDSSFSELEIAIKSVFEGHTYITPKVSKVIIKNYLQKEQNPIKKSHRKTKRDLKAYSRRLLLKRDCPQA